MTDDRDGVDSLDRVDKLDRGERSVNERAMSGAERQRLHRARKRRDQAVLRVPVAFGRVVTALIESDHLSEQDALDRERVAKASGRVLEEWARQWGRGWRD